MSALAATRRVVVRTESRHACLLGHVDLDVRTRASASNPWRLHCEKAGLGGASGGDASVLDVRYVFWKYCTYCQAAVSA